MTEAFRLGLLNWVVQAAQLENKALEITGAWPRARVLPPLHQGQHQSRDERHLCRAPRRGEREPHAAPRYRGPQGSRSRFRREAAAEVRRALVNCNICFHSGIMRYDLMRARSAPASAMKRARLILMLDEDLSWSMIGGRLLYTPDYIDRWKRRFTEERMAGLCTASRWCPESGRSQGRGAGAESINSIHGIDSVIAKKAGPTFFGSWLDSGSERERRKVVSAYASGQDDFEAIEQESTRVVGVWAMQRRLTWPCVVASGTTSCDGQAR